MEGLIAGIIKEVAKSAAEKIFEHKAKGFSINRLDFENIFYEYVKSVYRWSSVYQFLGMDSPKSVDDDSVALNYHTIPRRYRGVKDKSSKIFSELEFLNNRDHYIILGDPGSGKTTTLKRLVRLLIHEERLSFDDIYSTPVLIKLREIKRKDFVSLSYFVAEKMGFVIERGDIAKRGRDDRRFDKKYHIKESSVRQIVISVLEKSNALFLLDGLDEVPEQIKSDIYWEIEEISRYLENSKIIATCRSGDFYRRIEGFRTIEIMPLTDEQIICLSAKWLETASEFLEELKKLPYYDITDRPLLLNSLLYLYARSGDLPEQPSLVYKKMIRLLLEEWDHQRGVMRKSKYSKFDADRKLEFLSSLSFHLLYRAKTKTFSSLLLVDSYNKICATFKLPYNEARQVVREIETHNGLIIQVENKYEFSHLSIQEFLAANHIVRSPYSIIMKEYMISYPAPIAIAISISSEPSKWFASLILNDEIFECIKEANMNSFLKRLLYESPYFVPDSELGYAIIKLFDKYWDEKKPSINRVIENLFSIHNIKKSIAEALRECQVIVKKEDKVFLRLIPLWNRIEYKYFMLNEDIKIPKKLFKDIIEENLHLYSIKIQ